MIPPVAALAIPLGALLDATFGDPPGWPHPVRAIGGLIAAGERRARATVAKILGERAAGVALAIGVVAITAGMAWIVVEACDRLGPVVSLIGRSLLIFWGIAPRSLGVEALRAAEAPTLEGARLALSRIVGRDTEALDRPEICRACVETVAENANDAVVAPLFWLAVGGPVALWGYKAISTLDSMVGYRDARYARLGWASARLDDLAALLPARLTWHLIAISAGLWREEGARALRIGWRDGREHPSPNAAWGEAAMAGALGIQLGGPSTYRGVVSVKPTLGDPGAPIDAMTVRRAVRLMRMAGWLAVALATMARAWAAGAG